MKRLIQALAEYIEAKAELMREEAAAMMLDDYGRGYADGRADVTAEQDINHED